MKRSRAPFLFLRLLCVLLTDLKNNWHYCSKGNSQQNTHFKFYIDVWYLIVTQAENTPSTATVGINITQQNPTPKFVAQFEMNAKQSKRRSDQVFKMSTTSFHTSSSVKIMKSIADAAKRRSNFQQFATVSFCARRFFKCWRTIWYTEESWIPVSREILRVVLRLFGDLPESRLKINSLTE